MNTGSIILLIKKIAKQLIRGEILDWFYIGVILFLIGGIIIVSISTLVFLLHAFDAVIFISDKEVTSGVAPFNIASFEAFAPRFGINTNNMIPLSAKPQQKEEVPSPTPMPSLSLPSISPPSLSELKLRILNATGMPGLAKTWKERFEAKGLHDVSTGNALVSNEKGIIMTYKPGKEIFLETLREILKENKGDVTREQADSTLSDDVIIMIGR